MKKKVPASKKLDITKECTEMGCPFCGQLAELVVAKGHSGPCVLIQCVSDKCSVHPSTPMFDGRNAVSNCKKAWETRAKRLRRRKNG